MPYFTEENRKNIKYFRYNGKDNSILYNYVLNPFASYLTELIPMWVAPNLITVSGLFMIIICYFLTLYYSPYLNIPLPIWVQLFVGFSILSYQTLDNMDGKQARRTNSANTLGMLFDHGIDAIHGQLQLIILSAVFLTENQWYLTVIFYLMNIELFWVTWEHYTTGFFRMGHLNGPSEGIFLMYLNTIILCYDQTMFRRPLKDTFIAPYIETYDLSFLNTMNVVLAFYVLFAVATILSLVEHWNFVFFAHKYDKPTSFFQKLGFFKIAIPFHINFLLMPIWQYTEDLLEDTTTQEYPRIFFLVHGITQAHLVTKLFIYHTAKIDFGFCQPIVVPELIGYILFLTTPNQYHSFILITVFCINLLLYSRFIYIILDELTDIFDVYLFSLKKPIRNKKKKQ